MQRAHCIVVLFSALFFAFNVTQANAFKRDDLFAARDAMKSCIANAATQEEKAACRNNDNVKAVLAQIMGISQESVTEAMMMRLGVDEAIKSSHTLIKECFKSAKDDAAKKACRIRGDLKDSIAAATGKDRNSLKDSDVRKIVEAGAEDSAFAAMRDCKSRDDCLKRARNALAEATGVHPDAMKDVDIERKIRKGAARDTVKSMRACMAAAAGNEAQVQNCKNEARSALRDARPSRERPSDAEKANMIRETVAVAVSEVRASCADSNDAECKKKIKDEIALQLGKNSDDLTELDVKSATYRASVVEVASEAKACREAKADDANASCADLYDLYVKAQGRSPKKGKSKKVEEAKMKLDVARKSAAMSKRTCFERKTKDEIKNCLESVKHDNEGVVSSLGDGEDATQIRKRKKCSNNMATTSALGDVFADCMEAATTEGEKTVCNEGMDLGLSAANVKEGRKAFVQKYRGQSVADAVAACDASDATKCRKQAMEKLKKSGMKKHELRGVKLLGATKAAAVAWAACRDVEEVTTCDRTARETYIAISGGDDSVFSDKVQAKVRKLGQAIMNGVATEVRLKKSIDAGVSTDESSCSTASETTVLEKATMLAEDIDRRFGSLKSEGCNLVDGSPEYAFNVESNFANIESAAASLSTGMVGVSLRRLGENRSHDTMSLHRRLAVTSEAFASQSQEECSVDDRTCGSEDPSRPDASNAFCQRFHAVSSMLAAGIGVVGPVFSMA
eukprot:TRINITY_DN7943_c0_g1_i1.p1 TRINITY_DN7943_c0_g1~~TRINITY_DN7943_c0_g1_i1.p1  ORF type:complete len:737 (+),score=164.65 TRINITY_DN7943_c0_g1_i1:379-2589(+)